MNEWLTKLLDLRTLQWGVEGVGFGFERPIPAWAWGGIVGLSVAVALWSYWRLTGPVWMRAGLGMLRALLLVLLVFLISGPQLVQRNESVERDWVMVLADRSASMTIADAPGGEGSSDRDRVRRDDQARRAVDEHAAVWAGLAKDRVVQWLGFDAGVYDLGVREDGSVDLGDAAGRRTNLAAALDQALARAAARPLAAVVVMSDGRSISEPTRGAIRRLQAERVPVHVIPLGSELPIGDVGIRSAESPRLAFVDDVTPVRVELERLGGGANGFAAATVRLIDQATGLTLDERRVQWEGTSETVILTSRGEDAGARAWRVEVLPEGADLIAGNNASEFTVEMVDRPMRALFIDGYPRWEQRYLRNLLIREKSITATTLILSPDRRYLQEGDIEIDSLPDSEEAWGEYDAVILGDVSPDVFTESQLRSLRDHISRRGGGLLWIGGMASTPVSWFGTALGDLLPFPKEATDGQSLGEPVMMMPTATAERLGLLQLSEDADEPWPAELSDPSTRWAQLRWAQRIDPARLKPTAEVLGRVATGLSGSASVEESPLVMSMRYGSGRVLYVATDEIWRWRYGRGEALPERFWLQMIRLLGRESLSRSGRAALIEVSPQRTDVDQPVRVSVELLDQLLAEQRLATVQVRLMRKPSPGDTGAPTTAELILKPEQSDGRVYSALWLPSEAGVWTAEPLDSALAGLSLSAEAIVTLPDDELRRPETDFAMLSRLAEETGGSVLTVEEIGSLPERIPNRKVRLLNEVTESLWDTPFALLMVLLVVTLEWVGRRVIRLI